MGAASLTCEQADELIENLAQSEACFDDDYDRGSGSVSSISDDKIKDIVEKLGERMNAKFDAKFEKLSKFLVGSQRQMSFLGDSQGGYYEEFNAGKNRDEVCVHKDCNYLNKQGGFSYNKPFNQSHLILSNRNPMLRTLKIKLIFKIDHKGKDSIQYLLIIKDTTTSNIKVLIKLPISPTSKATTTCPTKTINLKVALSTSLLRVLISKLCSRHSWRVKLRPKLLKKLYRKGVQGWIQLRHNKLN